MFIGAPCEVQILDSIRFMINLELQLSDRFVILSLVKICKILRRIKDFFDQIINLATISVVNIRSPCFFCRWQHKSKYGALKIWLFSALSFLMLKNWPNIH